MNDRPAETLLITVSGDDHPGITSGLMALLTDAGATIGDVEQVVVRGHLVLGVVAGIPAAPDGAPDDELRKNLLLFGYQEDLQVAFDEVAPTPTEKRPGLVVTVIAPNVSADHFSAVARAIAAGGNIDRIVRIARYPVMAYELAVHRADIDELRTSLVELARELQLDIALQPEGLGRRAQRLVVLDVDSTLIQDEVIELLADEAGCGDAVRDITQRAMAGELDFEAALRERVRLLAGLTAADLRRARERVRLTPGARTFVRTLQRLGFRIAIVSGGFTYFTDHLKDELELDYAYANELHIDADGVLTGELVGPVVDRARKAAVLREVAALEGISEDQTVAVGDGANDLDMLAAAGLGIAFNAKPVVRDAAHTSLNVPYLDAILFVLGVRRSEVEAADEADGIVTEMPAV